MEKTKNAVKYSLLKININNQSKCNVSDKCSNQGSHHTVGCTGKSDVSTEKHSLFPDPTRNLFVVLVLFSASL